MEEEILVPIYLITGFLESGKTQFLNFTIRQDYFAIPEKTLLIVCEEGEEQYQKKELKKYNTDLVIIEKEEDLTPERLLALQVSYNPGRILIEYNGMWSVKRLEEMQFPEGWGIVQRITIVDGSTFQIYMNSMKSLFMEMIRQDDLVMFNRCNTEDPLPSYRRSIKAVNQGAEVVFEDEYGEIDVFADSMPFDVDAPIIEIAPEDYGIWYIDAQDNPARYHKKIVHFKGRVLKPEELDAKSFVPGRMAMTCCAEDMTFIGYVCVSDNAPTLKENDWVDVTAKVSMERHPAYDDYGPVLYAEKVQVCDPLEEELVYFN